MNLPVYNQQGQKVKDLKVNPAIFNVQTKDSLLHQSVVAQGANTRISVAYVKDRSEIRGGGRKPWKQKGTGRARHGSIRSPLWRGGGVTFGPRNINFQKKINKKAKKQALLMCLSEKAADAKIKILDTLNLEKIKTKTITEILTHLKINNKKIILALDHKDDMIIKSSRNIPDMSLMSADSLNIVDVLNAEIILTTVSGIEKIENTYGNSR